MAAENDLRLVALVVEYNERVGDALAALLSDVGFHVERPAFPEEALIWLRDQRPHVIVLDGSYPGWPATDLVRGVGATFGGEGLPILLSADETEASTDVFLAAMSEGPVTRLRRPFDAHGLEDALEVALEASPDSVTAELRVDEDGREPGEVSVEFEDEEPDDPEDGVLAAGDGSSSKGSGAAGALQTIVLYLPDAHETTTIESATPAGLRVRWEHDLPIGEQLLGRLDVRESRARVARRVRIWLELRLQVVTGEGSSRRAGLAVLSARPMKAWRSYCDSDA